MDRHPREEPSAMHRAFAKELRQMFVALQQEGFTTMEALTVIGQVIAANTGNGRQD
ncbi:hypothetical protein QOZ88_05880 [Blastococcus sp. BMG 814]|uniref:MarR family transcriptional regulator n=1 Tax=Blastococcus carthaginiensis TaxID=3050034 RepID=A0ABT9I9B9_9ACTN|nr:hypothetical protein [Blastococcus carthaginiensis]MDP5182159.1 hypothetical protein [Blastococcus carthaginiensis]